jgi:SAM-dependent methyltransferase
VSSQTDPKLLVDFFDDQQASAKYDVLKARTELIDRKAAQLLNAGARGYECDFAAGQFDTVVFPLILHHVAEGEGSTWAFCKSRIRDALSLAARWLKPGGEVLVMEYCPHPAWIPIQGALVPVTKRFLRAMGQPLVAMHSRDFYLDELRQASLSPRAIALETDGFTWRSWYPLFMATPWLKVPFAVFPKPYVFVGARRS